MSHVLLDFEKKALDFKLQVTDSPLSYLHQQHSRQSETALSIYIPYPILKKWHEPIGIKDERGNELNYIDLLQIPLYIFFFFLHELLNPRWNNYLTSCNRLDHQIAP